MVDYILSKSRGYDNTLTCSYHVGLGDTCYLYLCNFLYFCGVSLDMQFVTAIGDEGGWRNSVTVTKL